MEWNNSTLLQGDAAEAVRDLQSQQGPELMVPGQRPSHPMPAGMELVDSKTSGTGVVMATYRPAGELRLGSFAFEEPTAEEVERRQRLGGWTLAAQPSTSSPRVGRGPA
ncbi:MAG TPA: hypothetical protein VHG90_08530 [Acidimicrobiales bacterium]|nr:hypothetical protein [Acidimicrobiales bacterium]